VKARQLREMTDDELRERLAEQHKRLFGLRTQAETEKLEKPTEMTQAKREVARILTILGERGVKVEREGAPAGTRNVDNRNRQGDPAHSGGYRSDVASNPTAKWTDCPGCPKCEANPAECPDCLGTGITWPDPDIPMSNEEHRAYCEANPCLKCKGTGKYGGYVLRRGSWRHTRAHEFVFILTKQMLLERSRGGERGESKQWSLGITAWPQTE